MRDCPTRRDLLAGCVGAGSIGLSGCTGTIEGALGDGDDDDRRLRDGSIEPGSVPGYASFVPAGEDALVTAYDLTTEPDHRIGTVPEEPTDPLRYDAASGAVAATALAALVLGLGDAGFSARRLPVEEQTHFVGVDGVGVIVGPVDLDGLRSDTETNDLAVVVDEGDRLVFRGAEGTVVGATPDALVLGSAEAEFDAGERVRRVVAARAGAADRLVETDDAFQSLLSAGDTTGSVACAYAGDGDVASLVAAAPASGLPFEFVTSGFGAATGAVAHLTTKNGDPPQPASATVEFPDPDAIDADALTGSVGTAATDPAFVRDGTTVRASGTYTWADLSAYERDGLGVG